VSRRSRRTAVAAQRTNRRGTGNAAAGAAPGRGVFHDVHARRGGMRPDGPGGGVASVADALRVGRALGAYLNSPSARDLDGPARGEALDALGAIASLLGAASNGLLRRFDADYGHDAYGYATSAAWLAAKTHLGSKDAKAAVRQMRLLGRHPLLDAATATGAVTVSWAREIADWTGRIDHEELQLEADRILIDAAAAGADLDDLKIMAQAAHEAWRAQEPDPDEDPAGGASATGTCTTRPPSTGPGGSAGT
jgi:hypothetical protein